MPFEELDARQDRQGRIPRVPQAPARQERRRRAAGAARRRCCATSRSPSRCTGTRRSRTGGASCSSAGRFAGCCSSMAAGSCRSPSAGRPNAAGPQVQDVESGRADLRPPLPRHERPRRPVDQGPQLRRVPGAAAGALRRPRARRAPRSDRARARGAARRLGGRVHLKEHAALHRRGRRPRRVSRASWPASTIAAFLALPHEVLTTTLVHHQHYFPVVTDTGELKEAFLAVVNTQPQDERLIAKNAERVVTARLRDAKFFWEADRKTPLESRLDRLHTLLFHKKLGSYRDKAERIEQLAEWIAARSARAAGPTRRTRRRRRRLAKADLDDRHGVRVPRAAGHDGRHLRARGRAAGAGLEGHLLPVPADRRRGRRAAVARSSWARRR